MNEEDVDKAPKTRKLEERVVEKPKDAEVWPQIRKPKQAQRHSGQGRG
jgi:hypothetical protein